MDHCSPGMTSVIESREMNPNDAITLQRMMGLEKPTYLSHFTAFSEPGALYNQCLAAKSDGFFSLFMNNQLAGFFCMRGIDQGYTKPSFGVYVSSKYQGKGLARMALIDAEKWCEKHSIPWIMLKVADTNNRAYQLYTRNGFVPTGRCTQSGQTMMEKRIL